MRKPREALWTAYTAALKSLSARPRNTSCLWRRGRFRGWGGGLCPNPRISLSMNFSRPRHSCICMARPLKERNGKPDDDSDNSIQLCLLIFPSSNYFSLENLKAWEWENVLRSHPDTRVLSPCSEAESSFLKKRSLFLRKAYRRTRAGQSQGTDWEKA